MYRLLLSLLVLFSVHGFRTTAAAVLAEKRGNVTLPAPVVAQPSEHWEGNDGIWSTFEIRVGTPSVVLRVLPATSWQEVWVVWGTINACNTTLGVAANCDDARGGTFDATNSSTWKDEGDFSLGLNNLLGYDGVADYGFDTVGLGFTNSSGVTLQHQIVAEIQSDSFWFGMLGLGFQPTNFSNYGNPQASFSDTLVSNGTISSMSWSYTAGAYYRLKSVFGSLIFGGYDASRFTPNDVVFTMTGDNLRDIVLYVRTITSTSASGNTTLLSTPIQAFIDSTVVDFWLPANVCEAFENAFGLQFNSAMNRYFLNSSTHDKLLSTNPNVTFTLADQQTGGHTIDIVLPYASFDLNLSAPFVNTTTMYFPLRQGQNDSMYTLGRAFLQEAYVTTDYNTRTFNVSQCVFEPNANAEVLAIPSDMPTPISGGTASTGNGGTGGAGGGGGNGASGGGGLSGGAIAGIVIGAIAALILIGALLFCCFRGIWCFEGRRKEQRPSSPVHEIDSGKRIDPNASAYSAQASALTSEVPGQDAKVEIAGNPIMHPQELEAEVPVAYHNRTLGRLNGPSDSSEGTTQVSSVTQSPEGQSTEMHSPGGKGADVSNSDSDEVVSPTSPNQGHMPNILVTSPTDTHTTWSPETPVFPGRRF